MSKEEFGFKKLKVWQKAVEFANKISLLIETIETNRKHYRLIEQLESASCSISQNIAEGKGRYSNKEYIHFLYISRGSLYETITILNIFFKNKWINKNQLDELENDGIEIARMIKGLINSLYE